MGPQFENVEMGNDTELPEPHEGLTLLTDVDRSQKYVAPSFTRCLCSSIRHLLLPSFLLLVVVVIASIAVTFEVRAAVHRVSSSDDEKLCGQEPSPIMKLKEKSYVEGVSNGAVASDHPVCSKVGVHIMQNLHGNAVDAAVATTLCLGVANPASSGIGGGMFMLIHSNRRHHEQRWAVQKKPDFTDARDTSSSTRRNADMITEVIDARDVAPSSAFTEMYFNGGSSTNGGLAVAVPGELKGLELAHARHGSLDWAVVVEPAMKLARDGVVVSSYLASEIADHQDTMQKYNMTNLRKLISRSDGSMLREGDILKNTALAETFEVIMKTGADGVYKGARAKALASDVQAAGGILTEQDINKYKATLRSPLVAEANGMTLVGVPPPSSGGATVIGILRFLAGFHTPFASFADTLSIHRLVEAMRHAFVIRMSLSDPKYFTETVLDATHDLIAGNYMEMLREGSKDNETANLSTFGGPKWAQLHDGEGQGSGEDAHEGDRQRQRRLYRDFGYLEDHGTTHLSIVDSEGNAVSLTSSVNTYFGSGVVSESTGVVLNNQMDDFGNPGVPDYYGLKPSEANFIMPGKKPLSSMAPTMIFKKNEDSKDHELGDLFMALGASGGPKIISSTVQVFLNHAHLGMPLFEAVAHPRIHDQLLYHSCDVTCVENDTLLGGATIKVSDRTKSALARRGHDLIDVDYTGTVQAIAIDLETKTMSAVSDIRKGGTPAGY